MEETTERPGKRSSFGAAAGAVLAIVAAAALFVFGPRYIAPLKEAEERVLAMFRPCSRPETYSLGGFDERFGLSKKEFLAAIDEAERTWEEPAGRELFAPVDAGGALTVSLVYDYRQEATDKLRKLGLVIKDDQASYDRLKTRHDTLDGQLASRRATFEAAVAAFDARKAAYDKDVAYWNAKGGAPKEEFSRLNAERDALNAQAGKLNAERDAINALVADINTTVTVINRLAKQLNLTAATYNGVLGEQGEEFQEGLFTGDDIGGTIDIYEFDDRAKLVRVLAHELGHAIGLEHVEDPEAIMYRRNSGANAKPTAADLEALKRHCRLP